MQNRISYWEFIITDFNMRIHLEWQCISEGVVWLWNFIPVRIDVNHSSSATIKVDTIAMVLYQPILLLFLLIQNCNHLLASYAYLCAVCWLVHNFCLHCIFFWAMQDIVKLLAILQPLWTLDFHESLLSSNTPHFSQGEELIDLHSIKNLKWNIANGVGLLCLVQVILARITFFMVRHNHSNFWVHLWHKR